MKIQFTRDQIQSFYPPAGRYVVHIVGVALVRPGGASEAVLLDLQVTEPSGPQIVLHDRLHIRGGRDPHRALEDTARLLHLLHHAGQLVVPDEPVDLESLRGLRVLVDIAHGPGADGYPWARVRAYSRSARTSRRAASPRCLEHAR